MTKLFHSMTDTLTLMGFTVTGLPFLLFDGK